MENGSRINPANMLVEQSKIDWASELVEEIPLLDELETEYREEAVGHIAWMLTHNDISLFLADPGARTAVTMNFKTAGEGEKMIVVQGEKNDNGVNGFLRVIDPGELDELLENF
jgi:hypothetical protein